MKIVITGATGLIGRELTRKLLDRGHEVVAWSRSPETAMATLPATCSVARWDPTSVEPSQLAGADAVVHLAGENIASGRWSRARKKALADSRIESSRALVGAFAALPPGQRPASLISASAIGYYGDRGEEPLPEDAAPGEGFMPELCAEWEREIATAEQLGVRTASLRVGVVLDPNHGMLASVLPLFRLGLGGRLGSGQQWMSWIHVDDVVSLFVHVLERPEIRGPVNAAAPHPVRNADFTRELASCLQRPAVFPVPSAALRLAVGEMAAIMTASQRLTAGVAESSGFKFEHPALPEALREVCSRPEHVLLSEQIVNVPLEHAFEFFSDPRNLEKLTPPFLHFSITSLPEGAMRQESRIEYRLRLHGIPVRWRTRIAEWNPPSGFVDTQERGPYTLWHHTHELERCDGGTLVRDRVRYQLPLGIVGDLVAGRWVASDVKKIFSYRRERLPALLGRESQAA